MNTLSPNYLIIFLNKIINVNFYNLYKVSKKILSPARQAKRGCNTKIPNSTTAKTASYTLFAWRNLRARLVSLLFVLQPPYGKLQKQKEEDEKIF